MAKILWQLKRISTNEPLSDQQELPKNWKNIFGLDKITDRLGDLSWAGHPDMAWVEIGPEPEPKVNLKEQALDRIQVLLKESLEFVASDRTNATKGSLADWMEYRRLLNDVPNQPGFPEEIFWPEKPKE